MAGSQGTIRYLQNTGTVTFRVAGRGTMTQGMSLRRQAEHCFACGIAVRVDLRDCTYMDSTFIGTLLKLQMTADHRGANRFAVLAPSDACERSFEQMGLTDVLETEPAAPLPADGWVELSCEVNDLTLFKRNIEQAHEELAKLPGPAGEQFQQAVRVLKKADPAPPSPATPSSTPQSRD